MRSLATTHLPFTPFPVFLIPFLSLYVLSCFTMNYVYHVYSCITLGMYIMYIMYNTYHVYHISYLYICFIYAFIYLFHSFYFHLSGLIGLWRVATSSNMEFPPRPPLGSLSESLLGGAPRACMDRDFFLPPYSCFLKV